ncbi:recombinase family protein [Vibrio harveyi]|uniref:recombinase family protein n=1 Tax=Vibrio harveyi TaxID=669 RepID=UPI00238039DE|nr:recombinase family protein [Vibrio harveyi]
MQLSRLTKAMSELKPVVITYTRFSSNMQKDGLSEYRQDELTQRYVIDFCEEHNVPLDEVISLKDRGVSAYRGKNLTQGSLSEIIEKFESGELPKVYNEIGEINTFLFIESLDRLSRADLHTASKIFLNLVEYCNIVVVAENEQKIYSLNSLKDDMGMLDLFSALLTLSRSHNESRMKEMRSRSNWSKKRKSVIEYFEKSDEERKLLERPLNPTKTCPWWLQPKKNGRGFEFIEENRKAMNFFLDLLLQGFGLTSSIRKLNGAIENGDYKVKFTSRQAKAKGFQMHTFYQLLREEGNESLFGNLILHQDYYPTERDVQQGLYPKNKLGKKIRVPVFNARGFYPALISELDYLRIRQKMNDRRQTQSKPNKKVRNIAQGVLSCPKCGYGYSYVADNRKNRFHHLVCNLSRAKKCRAFAYKYETIEHNLLNYCRNLNVSRVLGYDNTSNESMVKLKELENSLERLIQSKKELEKEIDQLVLNIGKITIPTLLQKTQEQYVLKETEINRINSDIKTIEFEIHQLNQHQANSTSINQTLHDLIDKVVVEKNVEVRERLNIEFKKIIKKMHLIHDTAEGNTFKRRMLSVEFLDGLTRLIPVDKKLESSELYDILPALDFEQVKDFKEYTILPFDYLEGFKKGKYPDVNDMPRFYQENPAKYLKILAEIEEADEVYVEGS